MVTRTAMKNSAWVALAFLFGLFLGILYAGLVSLHTKHTPQFYCNGTTGVYTDVSQIQPFDPACGGAR